MRRRRATRPRRKRNWLARRRRASPTSASPTPLASDPPLTVSFDRTRRLNAGSFRQSDEIDNRTHSQLLHDATAVNLDGLFDRPQVPGDLLVQAAGNHV